MMLLLCMIMVLLASRDISAESESKVFNADSRYYLRDRLRAINPNLQWDDTGYLVELSHNYSTCDNLGQSSMTPIAETYTDGSSILALIDKEKGRMEDYLSVQMYVRNAINRWIRDGRYNTEFLAARKVGCTTKAGCNGFVVISCLFTPGIENTDTEQEHSESHRAFTPSQIRLVESTTGKRWDETHFLENLSMQEISCVLVFLHPAHPMFDQAKRTARHWNLEVIGRSGIAVNRGNTDEALAEILRGFNNVSYEFDKIGCSLIADCRHTQQMNIVVTCLFSKPI